MCDECHQHPHATMCPNGTPMVDVIYVVCALCGTEVDEETTTYGICEKCWTAHRNFGNALAYGAVNQLSVKINGLFEKLLTPDQIDEALEAAVMRMKSEFPLFVERETKAFLSDDDYDFADWLKKQKGEY